MEVDARRSTPLSCPQSTRNGFLAIPKQCESIVSLNECDDCNTLLAHNYEDHLSKWSLLGRSASQIRGKAGLPTFKNPAKTLRIGGSKTGLAIKITDPTITDKLMKEGGPYSFTVPTDGTSQPYIPLRAAMALVKVACSICPSSDLSQCQGAIDWLMQRTHVRFSNFLVLYAFTPGPIDVSSSEVLLLRRKHDTLDPYMWCLVQYGNHRLQAFVPFCPADESWFKPAQNIKFTAKHFPSRFGTDWPYGCTEFRALDWSGMEPVRSEGTLTFHVDHAYRIAKSEPTGPNTTES
jgi:hypothetical protein